MANATLAAVMAFIVVIIRENWRRISAVAPLLVNSSFPRFLSSRAAFAASASDG